MQKYELLYVLPAKYTEAEVSAMIAKMNGFLTSSGATALEAHDLGKRKLAYAIGDVRNGQYVLVFFEAETDATARLNSALRLSTDILRHLIVKRDPHVTRIPSLVDLPEMRDGEAPPRREHRMPPVQRVVPAARPLSTEELDKKIDEILTEEVL